MKFNWIWTRIDWYRVKRRWHECAQFAHQNKFALNEVRCAENKHVFMFITEMKDLCLVFWCLNTHLTLFALLMGALYLHDQEQREMRRQGSKLNIWCLRPSSIQFISHFCFRILLSFSILSVNNIYTQRNISFTRKRVSAFSQSLKYNYRTKSLWSFLQIGLWRRLISRIAYAQESIKHYYFWYAIS
jgi:hypothetical protein